MEEGDGTDHQKMKNKIQKEYKRIIKLVLRSELNARSKISTMEHTNSPSSHIQLWVIDWKLDEIQDVHRRTGKQLYMNRMLVKKVSVDRIYLPYLEDGRGLMTLEKEYKATMVECSMYMIEKVDPKIAALLKHQRPKALF